MPIRRTCLILAAILLAVPVLAAPAAWAQPHRGVVHYAGGLGFDGAAFVPIDLYVADGVFRADAGGRPIEKTVDLTGKFLVPPFADAHTHQFADGQDVHAQIADSMRKGIFYAKNPNNTRVWTADLRAEVNGPGAPDVVYANGGLTSTGGHPAQIYDAAAERAARRSGEEPLDMDGEGYFAIDTAADLAARWPEIVGGGPGFIKAYLEASEHHEVRKNDPAYYGKRGIDPALLPEVVERAHAHELRVSVHVATARDFRVAVRARADEINHLPLERLEPADARAAARAGVTVVTTTLSHRPSAHVPDLDAVHVHNLTLLRDAGVRLAIGTDDGSRTARDEYENLQRLGEFEAAVLLAMWTRDTPEAIFPGRRFGRLAPGYEASFLALDANPLEDPAAHRAIGLRVKRGHEIDVVPEPPAKPSIGDALRPHLMAGNLDAAIAEYRRLKQQQPGAYSFAEQELNYVGYALAGHGQLGMALAILKLNAAEFPHSPNAHDSVAEICERIGDAECVAAASKRVLELLPESHYPDEVKDNLAASANRRLAGDRPPEHGDTPESPDAGGGNRR
jgi:hypothetical protein